MLTIVHIINGLESGGAETSLFNLCTYDQKNRHIVISLVDEGRYYSLLKEKNIEVYCLDLKGKGLLVKKLYQLYRLLKKVRPDVVQTWMYHSDLIGGVIARLAGVRKVFWGIRNSILTPELSKRSTILVSRICSLLSYFVPYKIICCADKALSVHASLGYRRSIMEVINNGYVLSKFNQDSNLATDFLSEIKYEDTEVLLGCVGRFDPNKDHKNLLNALAIVKKQGLNFRCCLVGNQMTKDNPQLRTWINSNNLDQEVLLIGLRSDIPAVMNAIDIHILSSVAEAFPNVICEAMACGTPCVSTDVGDAAIIVADTGWIVPASDATLLADAIVSAIKAHSDKSVWQQRSAACRSRIVDNFGVEKMVAAYQRSWSSTL
ncbi:glycosyltransferase [Rheinheimera aquimaris]|uniref:Glycosyltransferase n=1 Tax=Rheinheimera aquimaris TaxID=412437 RepID=A0ABP3N8E0_9GAMM|nr:glycosyltransferase [Rheinheimera aquimaris]MCB5212571.1 glycosyltransferase [Rheinheimera aquimaris]